MIRSVIRASFFCCAGVLVAAVTGCKDLTGNALPVGVKNPNFYNTPAGAQGLYTTTFYTFEAALLPVILDAGLITDELEDHNVGMSPGALQGSQDVADPLDERILPEGSTAAADAYGDLQAVRAYADQARAALLAYDTVAADSTKVRTYRGSLALFTGYAEIWLADFYCSGVPLSTVDFQKDFTYAASSTTTQVYRAALAQFDTALALTRDSVALQNTIHVARGRIYLALGQYDSAAAEVHGVPTAFQYQLSAHMVLPFSTYNVISDFATVSDREGANGLPYVSSGDPRTATTVVGASGVSQAPLRYPVKFASHTQQGFTPFMLASGIEARLIEAEAALHAGNVTGWLTLLNQLRTTGVAISTDTLKVPADTLVDTLGYTGCTSVGACDPDGYQVGFNYSAWTLLETMTISITDTDDPNASINAECRASDPLFLRNYACTNPQVNIYGGNFVPAIPLQVHVVYAVGTGGVSGLAPLTDPGASLTGSAAATARVRLLFDERGYWLFMTGHRQGDLRRLVRQYGWPQNQVYPVGTYTAPGTGMYGTDVTMPIPATESANPNFHGCLDRNA